MAPRGGGQLWALTPSARQSATGVRSQPDKLIDFQLDAWIPCEYSVPVLGLTALRCVPRKPFGSKGAVASVLTLWDPRLFKL